MIHDFYFILWDIAQHFIYRIILKVLFLSLGGLLVVSCVPLTYKVLTKKVLLCFLFVCFWEFPLFLTLQDTSGSSCIVLASHSISYFPRNLECLIGKLKPYQSAKCAYCYDIVIYFRHSQLKKQRNICNYTYMCIYSYL